MTPGVEDLFHDVADLTHEERTRYFALHGVTTEMIRDVEALLEFDEGSETALADGIGKVAQQTVARLEPSQLLCGAYQLGEFLGRGGMGSVYLAERADGEVSHHAAVKLLRPGGDEPHLRQRFLAERQILAGLSHPNIARLLDAGHREDGQPYLVMEYVDGIAVDLYASGLGLRQKLALFVKVCAAVSYLHRNLVVHRDLKPANILVTREGEPKLLDFGIAKIIDLTTDATVTSMRMLTPEYASPEQVAGAPVSTATDIYSLGAILYKILTGKTPHQAGGHSVHTIAERIAGGHIITPSRVLPSLRGDLDSIILKALRRDPQDRYATVEQFSEDLENYLECRPIRARKSEVLYRARKFVRRYWLPVIAAAVAIAGLNLGILAVNKQRTIAQERLLQIRNLANQLFVIDEEVRKTPGTTKARQLIVETSLDYLRRLAPDVRHDPELALEVGNAYMRVARVQGVPVSSNLGQMDKASQNLKIAAGLIGSVLDVQPLNRTALLRAAQIAHDRMLLARFETHSAEALAYAREADGWLGRLHATTVDEFTAPGLMIAYWNVADQYVLAEQYDDALRLCNEATGIALASGRPLFVADLLQTSAEVYRRRGDLEEALRELHKSSSTLDPGNQVVDQGRMANYVLALMREGRILGEYAGLSLGRYDEAVVLLERSFTIADDFAHRDPNDQNSRGRLARTGLLWARILYTRDAARSLAIYDHVLRHLAEVNNNSSFRRYETSMLAGSSQTLLRMGRRAEAKTRIETALRTLQKIKLYPSERIRPGSELDEVLSALAEYQAATGHETEAVGTYEQLLQKEAAWGAKPESNLAEAVDVTRVYAALALLNHRVRQHKTASDFEVKHLKIWEHWVAGKPDNEFFRRHLEAAEHPAR
jgi:tetratricopeptide (TPR) repeat protein